MITIQLVIIYFLCVVFTAESLFHDIGISPILIDTRYYYLLTLLFTYTTPYLYYSCTTEINIPLRTEFIKT